MTQNDTPPVVPAARHHLDSFPKHSNVISFVLQHCLALPWLAGDKEGKDREERKEKTEGKERKDGMEGKEGWTEEKEIMEGKERREGKKIKGGMEGKKR